MTLDASVLEWNLRILGLTQVVLALMHVDFSRRFAWRKELPALSLINRQLMSVHTFFVAYAVFLNGCLCFFAAPALLERSTLGIAVTAGLTLFWLTRLYFQFFVFDRQLWVGRGFESVAHVVAGLVWLWYSSSFGLVFLIQIGWRQIGGAS